MNKGLVWLGAVAFCATLAAAEPAVSFSDAAVGADHLTPGGKVAYVFVSREHRGWHSTVVRRDGLVTADASGAVRLDLERELSPRSVWAFVDMTTGERVLAAPDPDGLRAIDLPGNSLRRNARGVIAMLQDQRQVLELLVVRPGAGAWGLTVGDGGASDADGANDGTISVAFASSRAVAAESPEAAPDQLEAGDIVVVIDPRTLQCYAAAVGER